MKMFWYIKIEIIHPLPKVLWTFCNQLFCKSKPDRIHTQASNPAFREDLDLYEGHSVYNESEYFSSFPYWLRDMWCCLYKVPTFDSHDMKETIS